MAKENIIEVQNLKTYFHTPEGIVKSVDGVSFSIEKGKTMALVGESGCGKTQTSLSLIRLLAPTAKVSADKIEINGKETKDYTKDQARGIRGKDISMIFQEPMTSLNPVYRVRQLEMIRLHQPELSKQDTYQKGIKYFDAGRDSGPQRESGISASVIEAD
ncbi:MAG: ATP-binding cassette domain-containing protein [Clostridium sp.]